MKNDSITRKHSSAIYKEYKSKPTFSRPTELLSALEKAKEETGLYPVYTKSKTADKFVRFLNEKELSEFKAFGKPRWKPHGKDKYGLKLFNMEIADTYAGGMFPDRTPYEISAMWRKGGLYDGKCKAVEYEVSLFIDYGRHIDTHRVYADKPIPLKKVLAEAVKRSMEIKGKCYDGYVY